MLPKVLFAFASLILLSGWAAIAFGSTAIDGKTVLPSLVTASIAAASIIYSLSKGQEAAKDQYTLSLIARRFDGGDYAHNIRIASDLLRAGILTSESTLAQLKEATWIDPLDNSKKMRASYAIIPILNYWEHCCTAYVDDRINRQLFEDLAQDLIREMVNRYAQIVGGMRAEEADNMEHLCAVWFVVASDDERTLLCKKLGPAPSRLCPDDQWRWARESEIDG